MNDLTRELGSALGIAIVGSLFSSGYRNAISGSTAGLPPEAVHALEESPGAGLSVASQIGAGGDQLADAVRGAFSSGLHDALIVGSVIALFAAGYTLLRAPVGVYATATDDTDADEIRLRSDTGAVLEEALA